MTTETKFEVGKYYNRGDGELVRVVCVDAPGWYPVVGVDENGEVETFTAEGHHNFNHPWQSRDLIPTPIEPKKKGVMWVNVYDDGTRAGVYQTQQDADFWSEHAIARIRVNWEEGRFDD
jgi:hypothetical protein